MKQKLLFLLVLLLTATTGAWAQDAKHLITDTYAEQTRSLEQPLPYATTIGALYDAVTGESFSDLISGMSAVNKPLTGISSGNTSVVSIGEFNDANTPVTVKADGEATVAINFSGYNRAIHVIVVPPLYVTMADGTADAYNWTATVGTSTNAKALPIGGLKGDGSETVTLQYNGRLKVKGVKAVSDAAPAAKEPATVTTVPMGAAVVVVGKTTELVSGGVADGGTLMYAVTTTNTKPTSTAGFSASVPTAQTITASGKVYVWYFVKADDTHTDSEIAATAIEVPVADIIWDGTNISDLRVSGTYQSYTKEGVKLSGNADDIEAGWRGRGDKSGIYFEAMESGGYTFTAPTGQKFTKIEMTLTGSIGWDNASLGTGWAFVVDYTNQICKVTWTGNAATTVDLLKGASSFNGESVKSIAFYLSE